MDIFGKRRLDIFMGRLGENLVMTLLAFFV
jgi:hypothetical protein